MRYKVEKYYERNDGKALRKFTRGSTISAKDAAKMAVRPDKALQSPLDILISGGYLIPMPDGGVE